MAVAPAHAKGLDMGQDAATATVSGRTIADGAAAVGTTAALAEAAVAEVVVMVSDAKAAGVAARAAMVAVADCPCWRHRPRP